MKFLDKLLLIEIDSLNAIIRVVASGKYKKSNGFYWECLN